MIALLRLGGDLALADPGFLALLLVLPLALAVARRRRPALLWAGLAWRPAPRRTLRARLARAPLALELAGAALAILALARPQRIVERVEVLSRGVDIVLVLDVSGSMTAPDLDPAERKSRLDAVKEVADRFVAGRRGDRVGVVAFALYPRVLCPPTLDIEAVRGFLREVKPVAVAAENRTGLGAGLARAVAMLHQAEARSRVVVLLTDGEENVREIEPLEAARAAKQFGVRVHTVAAGRYEYVQGLFGRLLRQEAEIDTRELREIARLTGGRFFRARDAGELERTWADIDRMEKSELRDRRWVDARDLAAPFIAAGVLVLLSALACGLFVAGGLP